jgi:ABC-type branched-subunit amino acid transport system permease subunit
MLAIPPWVVSEYQTHVLTTSLYYVVLAVGWNLLAGYTGQFSLAHHTFAGIGAYTSALLILYARAPILVSGEATLPPLPPRSPTACAPSPCPPGQPPDAGSPLEPQAQ